MLQRAYGLTISGLPRVDDLELVVDASAAPVDVRCEPHESAPPDHPLNGVRGTRRLDDGRVLSLDRLQRTAVFYGPRLSPDLLAHPYLGPVATAFSRWEGRESFHAGAFVRAGRAWAVTGPRTAGKSTLLAALAARGTPVLADDILVTDGDVVLPGPRCVDLREAPPFDGLDLRPARRGARLRLRLPAAPLPVALGGWFFLSWGDTTGVEAVPVGTALSVLAARRAAPQLASDPTVVFSLGTLPAWKLIRPRRFDAVEATLELLDRTVDDIVGAGPRPAVHR